VRKRARNSSFKRKTTPSSFKKRILRLPLSQWYKKIPCKQKIISLPFQASQVSPTASLTLILKLCSHLNHNAASIQSSVRFKRATTNLKFLRRSPSDLTSLKINPVATGVFRKLLSKLWITLICHFTNSRKTTPLLQVARLRGTSDKLLKTL
jgi:hypothetical protein